MHRTMGQQFARHPFLFPAAAEAPAGGGGTATADPPVQRGPAINPGQKFTMDTLKEFIKTEIDRVVGSTWEERIKAHRAEQSGHIDQLLNGLQRSQKPKEEQGIFAAKIIMAMAASSYHSRSGRPISPEAWAAFRWGKGNDVEKAIANSAMSLEQQKALSATIGTEGGFLVPEEVSTELIQLIRPQSAVRSLNPTYAPMEGGNLTLPKLVGGATATYIGENQNILPSQPSFGQVRLIARKLAGLVPISNDLIRRAAGNAEQMIRDDLVAALTERSDLAFLRGVGTEFTPRGLRYWANPVGKVIVATAGQTLVGVTTDLAKMILALRTPVAGQSASQTRMIRPGWIMSPRTQLLLQTIRDANGNFAFRAEMMPGASGTDPLANQGTLWGFPYRVTSQIPDNLGGGTNESELYLADFADVVLGETTGVLIDTSSEAAYFDGAAIQAAFSLDQTLVRAIVEHDLGMRNEGSVAVLTAVTWAP
jgi:HK97 family phage major capsid protein